MVVKKLPCLEIKTLSNRGNTPGQGDEKVGGKTQNTRFSHCPGVCGCIRGLLFRVRTQYITCDHGLCSCVLNGTQPCENLPRSGRTAVYNGPYRTNLSKSWTGAYFCGASPSTVVKMMRKNELRGEHIDSSMSRGSQNRGREIQHNAEIGRRCRQSQHCARLQIIEIPKSVRFRIM